MEIRDPSPNAYATACASRDVQGLQLMEANFPSGRRIPLHSHEHAVFCMALSGACTELFANRPREYTGMTVQYLPPDEPHSLTVHNAGLRCFNLSVPQAWLSRARECSLVLDTSVHGRGDSLAALFTKVHTEFRRGDAASSLAIEGLALEMLAEVSRRQLKTGLGTMPRWLEHAREFLSAHSAERVNLLMISNAVGVHPVHLAREFRKRYHCTVGDYLRQLRIESACRQLARSNSSLAEIALAAGFADQSHFGRIFKRSMGMTPAQYRSSFPAS